LEGINFIAKFGSAALETNSEMLTLGVPHAKQAVQGEIWVQTRAFARGPRKTTESLGPINQLKIYQLNYYVTRNMHHLR
jgi:hypothetical protein